MNKLIAAALCCATLVTLCACTGTASSDVQEATAAPTEAATEAPVVKQPSEFDGWPSNTAIATGSNYIVTDANEVTYRTYFPVELSGEQTYRFYFSNTVDSTWERGRMTHAGEPGGAYTIISASIADGGTSPDDPLTGVTEVTFDGTAGRSVEPGETYWSDEITVTIPEGHYLVWEWTLTGESIPCTRMTELAYSFAGKSDPLTYNMNVPLPQLLAAERDVKLRIAAFGDSITQGAQTTPFAANFWVSELSEQLGDDYAVWNCGLGYARASDAALCGNWLERAKSADIVTVAFGTNDLVVGRYGTTAPSTPEEIETWLRTIVNELQEAGCTVILFNAPPFDFDADHEAARQELNVRIAGLAEETGAELFDWAALLEDPDDPAHAVYGGHPDDEGCRLVAEAFLTQFAGLLGTE